VDHANRDPKSAHTERYAAQVSAHDSPPPSLASDLQHYLQEARTSMVSALDGLSGYDVRRPLVPSATNLLGLVKHLLGIELSYLVECVGRPSDIVLPWVADGSIWEGADMWATPNESRDDLLALYRSVWAAADASISELDLAAPAHVPWWQEGRRDTTFGHLLVRVVAETAQHAGHADIARELIDGRGGDDHDLLDETGWRAYRAKVQAAADAFR
jgi:hypothetical protein